MKYIYVFLAIILSSSINAEQPCIRIYYSYFLPFVTLEEYQELIDSSSVMVKTRALLRPPPDFSSKIEEDEPLVDFLNRIIPPLYRSISPNQLVVVVIKRDSIERIYIPSIREKISPEACKGITLSPGDIIALGTR